MVCPICGAPFVNIFPAGQCEECGLTVCGHCIHHDHPEHDIRICESCIQKKTPIGKLKELPLEQLIRILLDPEQPQSQLAARLMGEQQMEKALEPLCRALESNRVDVRREAAVALGRIGNEAAVKPLAALLEDETAAIRAKAVSALSALNAGQALEKITQMIDDPSRQVAGHALHAIARLDGKNALPLLCDLFVHHTSPFLKCETLFVLSELDADAAVREAIRGLKVPEKEIVVSSCKVLGRCKDPTAVGPLEELLGKENLPASVRSAAKAALIKIQESENR